MGGKTMSEGVTTHFFLDLGAVNCLLERSLKNPIIHVMSAHVTTSGVNGALFSWENVLPLRATRSYTKG
jgi:hypothetical protein